MIILTNPTLSTFSITFFTANPLDTRLLSMYLIYMPQPIHLVCLHHLLPDTEDVAGEDDLLFLLITISHYGLHFEELTQHHFL